MKRYLPFIAIWLSCASMAQSKKNLSIVDTIYITNDLTTILFFPDSVRVSDIGNRNLFKASQDFNKILLYAHPKLNDELRVSSLYIELPSGHYYDYILSYRKVLPRKNYRYTYQEALGINTQTRTKIVELTDKEEKKPQVTEKAIKTKEDEKKEQDQKQLMVYEKDVQNILKQKDFVSGIGHQLSGVAFWMNGNYVKDDLMYFKLTIKNTSTYDYDISRIRFAISNRQSASKKTAIQDSELPFIYPIELIEKVKAGSSEEMVFIFNRTTLAKKKFITVDLWEKGGQRDLQFRINSKTLLKAKSLH